MPRLIRLACLGTALAAMAVEAQATTIVIAQFTGRMVAGADSACTLTNEDGTYTQSTCKIIPTGALLFVAAGLVTANKKSVADMAQHAGSRVADPELAMDELTGQIRAFLRNAFATQTRLDWSKSEREQGRVVLEAAYLGIRSGRSEIVMENYRAVGSTYSDIRILVDREIFHGMPGTNASYVLMGVHETIDALMKKGAPVSRNTDQASRSVKQLIESEIETAHGASGGSIDIAELKAGGVRWSARKEACRAR